MKKWMKAAALLLALCLCLTGCSKSELPEGLEEAAVEAKGKEVIELIAAGDYEKVMTDYAGEDLNAQVTAEQLREALQESMTKLGALKEYKKFVTGGASDKESGEEYGVTMITVKYEEGKATFTLSFDLDMKLEGIYVR